MISKIEVVLPGGIWADGVCMNDVFIRPINGEDEAFLLESATNMLPAQWVTALLARCVSALETMDRINEDTVRSLRVGDREALLLHLRRLTFGDRMQCILACPIPECKEKMDLDLNVKDLLLQPYPCKEEWHRARLNDNGQAYEVCFRVPTGADQEIVSELAQIDLLAASRMLLHRCIRSIATDGKIVEELPVALELPLSRKMAELDPQAELVINIVCPACKNKVSVIFDTASYLSQEMAIHIENIYREVHMLAFYYHWSESDILGMNQRKRGRYLELLDETLKEWR